MSMSALPNLPSLRKQQLYLDFASLKTSCPESIYLSLTPSNPALWSGVFFVREGPYNSAILRFQISFPDTYPDLPPLITFSTEIFHPLLVPLTTYTFSTGVLDATGTVSATDAERLPAGAFSLRNGFPYWFGRARNSQDFSRSPVGSVSAAQPSTPPPKSLEHANSQYAAQYNTTQNTSISKVLAYIKSAFEDDELLDKIPLEAAGNSGAWHAWRAYRGLPKAISRAASPVGSPNRMSRQPGDWNWDGVWESRVKSGIQDSLSDHVLFSSGKGGHETIRFANMNEERFVEAKSEILETEGAYVPS